MDYEEDLAAEMRAGETLGKGRSRPTAGRNNVEGDDFDIIDSQGIIVGTMTVREDGHPLPVQCASNRHALR